MRELTDEQLERQDFVNGEIFELVRRIDPSGQFNEWNVELIGDIRDVINHWLVEHFKICDDMAFYPYVVEDDS